MTALQAMNLFMPIFIILLFAGVAFWLGYDVARYAARHGNLKGQHPNPQTLPWYRDEDGNKLTGARRHS